MVQHTCTSCYQTCKIISTCAGKRWLLTCIQHTRRPICVQHTKHYSRASYHRATHELLLACSVWKIARMQCMKNCSRAVHEIWLACIPFRVTCVFWLELRWKLKNTRVFTACKCQLRHELYCMQFLFTWSSITTCVINIVFVIVLSVLLTCLKSYY